MKVQWLLHMCLLVAACREPQDVIEAPENTLFSLLSSERTGIVFTNSLEYDEKFNIYTYRNFYNGGGVALGDINNDGLLDIYLTANLGPNKLFLNKGNFEFEDITQKAKVGGTRAWSTGVTMADVNSDGWLDIYVCNSGDVQGDNKQNELFINNGDLTFSETAANYGIADPGFSTHGAFFDYDKDGDLDLYLLNNSYRAIGSFNLKKNERPKRDPVGGDKLYRNDQKETGTHAVFVDVTEAARIYGSVIGFGLGVSVGDVNNDGWPDIYISNDFFERDYLYINNHDGTFSEELEQQIPSISAASMGSDMADINNDGHPDIFVTDMLPGNDARLKTVTTFENWDRYQYGVKNGYYHQFIRNMLHLNNGNNTFSEIGRLAGVAATDWSWGALIADFDNDGFKDIFVSNGIHKDLTNQDYLNYISNEEVVKALTSGQSVNFRKLIDLIPSVRVPNYIFANGGAKDTLGNVQEYTFINRAKEWGLATPSHSNGSAYGDLDNDGDLDLVVNNVNMPVFVYRNELERHFTKRHYLKVNLVGEGRNLQAIGTKLSIRHQGKLFYLEQNTARGFQSSVDPRLNFGLGNIDKVDTLLVLWPDQRQTILTNVATNQEIIIYQSEAREIVPLQAQTTAATFKDVSTELGISYTHQENPFVDFDRDALIYHMLSTEGPRICAGDINADGLEDFYIGGAKGFSGSLFLQRPSGGFEFSSQVAFEQDKIAEDTDALFFDADNDGDPDLYVASGGNEFSASSTALKDRLYKNDGRGNFSKSKQSLSSLGLASASCVKVSDFDHDGDLDLFVGTRLRPFFYGLPVSSFLLENDGNGNFKDITKSAAPGLQEIGMVTDAIWSDIDNDQDDDLIVVGDYLPITVFRNQRGKLQPMANNGLEQTSGWWNSIASGDFDQDGDLDFVVGNHGLNSRFKATPEAPVQMYVTDFDQNGTVEQIILVQEDKEAYPLVLRHDLIKQIPGLKKKYLKYESYQEQQIQDIFTADQLSEAIINKASLLETSLIINEGEGQFLLKTLPIEAQLSPVYGLMVEDFNQDGHLDILLGGNLHKVKPEVGRYDASYGQLLQGDGRGNFESISVQKSGLCLSGEVRDLVKIKRKDQSVILIGKNDDQLQAIAY